MFTRVLGLIATFVVANLSPHDPQQRLAEVSALIGQRPNDPALHVERGHLRLALGEPLAAREDFATATRLDPQRSDARVGTAFVEHRLGNDVSALMASRKAVGLGARSPSLQRLRGQILMALARPEEAAAEFCAAIAATTRHEPEHYLETAEALVAAGKSADARAVLDGGLAALGPVIGLIDAAVALDVGERAFDRALARLESLRRFMRKSAPLHERRAKVLDAAGRHADAAREVRLAVRARVTAEDDEGVAVAVPERLPAAAARAWRGAPSSAVPILASALAPTPTRLVATGSVWRYRDLGTYPGLFWALPTFNDSAWPSGPAQLGYGDGDEATVVASGPAGAHFPTTWFRHTFTIGDSTTIAATRLRLLCDDGAVVYLNGFEVARSNVANGFPFPTTLATSPISGAMEGSFRVFPFPSTLLAPGDNVLAVEVHQVDPTSDDLSFDLELLSGSGPIEVVRGPYLQGGTPTSAEVLWRTDQPTATQLWLGTSAASAQPVYFDATLSTEHTAPATGLQPETLYHYAIGDAAGVFGSVPAATLTTLPWAGAVRPLRAWVLGDAGWGSAAQLAVRDAYVNFAGAQPADAILMLGDNAYYIGTDAEYQNGLFDVYGDQLRSAFCWSTLGNHDASSANTTAQSGVYYDVFSLPAHGEAGGLPSGTEAYYSFDRGHVHFICLDSMDSSRSATGAMMTWLQADLAADSARWTIAFFHHPPYSFGGHHSDNPFDSGGRLFDMRQIALPILEAGGVDLVLSGHSHDYERSFLIDGHYGVSSSLQPGNVLDRGDGQDQGDGHYAKASTGSAPHQGAVYVVAGSAGSIGGGPLNHPAMCVSLAHLGSLVLDIDGDRLDATFVGIAGVEDRFTLVKGEARTLFRDQPRISVGSGGRQDFRLVAGPQFAGQLYALAGSYGTEPGMSLMGAHVPLNFDSWLQMSVAAANSSTYPGSMGVLDSTGSATSALVLPPPINPAMIGQTLYHAFLVFDGATATHVSNTVKVTFVP
ncbi:MAG: metallophosphoesterase [Planctomycetota bacterium]